MTTHHYNKVHRSFELNGTTFNEKTLKELAYSFVKEGVDFEKEIGHFLLDWLSNNDSIVVMTSGSTGVPKSITLRKKAMVNSAIATGSFFNLKEKDKVLLCLPASYIAGKMMLVRALVLGLEIDCIKPSSKIQTKGNMEYNFAAMVPMQVQNSIEHLEGIKTLIIGGAPVSSLIISSIKNIKTEVYETYGMTETITHIALKKLNNFSSKSNFNTFFKILPNITISKDERDCLVIAAPQLTKEKIRTNDVVKLHSINEFEWLGRYDNIINSGGVKINPEQVEKKLKNVIENRFFIASEKDNVLGEKVVLYIESSTVVSHEVISNKIKDIKGISNYERPKKIILVPQFIQTTSGKIKRKESIAAAKT